MVLLAASLTALAQTPATDDTLAGSSDTSSVGRTGRVSDGLPEKAVLKGTDLVAALAIFLIVVASTFPVLLPFLLISDVATAKSASRAIALAMLFFGGLALGRYAGYGSWKVGATMAGLGTGLVVAINAPGADDTARCRRPPQVVRNRLRVLPSAKIRFRFFSQRGPAWPQFEVI